MLEEPYIIIQDLDRFSGIMRQRKLEEMDRMDNLLMSSNLFQEEESRGCLSQISLHETPYGTFHSNPDSEKTWTIYDTRGTIDGGPSCSHCDACECYSCFEIHKNDPNRPCSSRGRASPGRPGGSA